MSSIVNDTINCNVWKVCENFNYPENKLDSFKDKLDIGIAAPGGGNRACTYTLGCLRGLQNIKLSDKKEDNFTILDKIRYISSNSGSQWLFPLLYNKDDITIDEFIGKYIEPSELKLADLESIDPKYFTYNLYNKNIPLNAIKNFINNKFYNPDNNDFYTETIGEIYLKPYGLDGINTLPCVETTEQKLKDNGWKDYAVLHDSLPFNIINTSCCDNDNNIRSLEFTALYYGFPNNHSGINYIEPIGFGSKNLTQSISFDDKGEGTIECNRPTNVISLSESIGYSSNVVGQFLVNRINTKTFNFLNLPSIEINHKLLKVFDGAFTDNTGIIALLRRRVSTIICLRNNESDPANISTNIDLAYGDIAGLFGCATSSSDYYGQSIDDFNRLRQVFYSYDWEKFKNEIINNTNIKNRNRPLVFKMDLRVQPNDHCGVEGGYPVRLIFICSYIKNGLLDDLDKTDTDESRKIHQLITKNNIYVEDHENDSCFGKLLSTLNIKSNEFEQFPYIPTLHNNYSKKLVNAMIYMGTYDVMNRSDDITRWINEWEKAKSDNDELNYESTSDEDFSDEESSEENQIESV
jgi:hypothetical protein